jgi:hypothetical protein
MAPVEALVEKLLNGGPRQATDAYMALSRLVRGGADLAPALESTRSKDAKRNYQIGCLVEESHRRHGRRSKWWAWLERLGDDQVTSAAFLALGNSRSDESAYQPHAIALLNAAKASAETCHAALYFLSHQSARHPGVMDAKAKSAVKARLGDARRTSYGTVGKFAKVVLSQHAVGEALRELADKSAKKRAKGAGRLSALLVEAVDVRKAYPALAEALSDSDVSVRRNAALAASYAFDMQSGIPELRVLRAPVARAAKDQDAQVREHAQAALRRSRGRKAAP